MILPPGRRACLAWETVFSNACLSGKCSKKLLVKIKSMEFGSKDHGSEQSCSWNVIPSSKDSRASGLRSIPCLRHPSKLLMNSPYPQPRSRTVESSLIHLRKNSSVRIFQMAFRYSLNPSKRSWYILESGSFTIFYGSLLD